MNRILLAGWLVLGLSTLAMAQKKEVIKDFKISVAREKLVLTPGTSERDRCISEEIKEIQEQVYPAVSKSSGSARRSQGNIRTKSRNR